MTRAQDVVLSSAVARVAAFPKVPNRLQRRRERA